MGGWEVFLLVYLHQGHRNPDVEVLAPGLIPPQRGGIKKTRRETDLHRPTADQTSSEKQTGGRGGGDGGGRGGGGSLHH